MTNMPAPPMGGTSMPMEAGGGGMGKQPSPDEIKTALYNAAKELKQMADEYGVDLSPIFAKGKGTVPPPPVATPPMG